MRIEIDQSGKIENTNKLTVLGFSNSANKTILILAREKKSLQRYFRKIKKPRLFIYITFSVLIYLLIKNHLEKINQIIIDSEYPGYENLIKQKVKEIIIENFGKKDISISIMSLGKKSKAHSLVYYTYKKRLSVKKRVLAKEIIRIVEKNTKKSGSI